MSPRFCSSYFQFDRRNRLPQVSTRKHFCSHQIVASKLRNRSKTTEKYIQTSSMTGETRTIRPAMTLPAKTCLNSKKSVEHRKTPSTKSTAGPFPRREKKKKKKKKKRKEKKSTPPNRLGSKAGQVKAISVSRCHCSCRSFPRTPDPTCRPPRTSSSSP